MCCSMLQYVAVCCSVLCVAFVRFMRDMTAVCCSVCRSVSQCVAMCCSVLCVAFVRVMRDMTAGFERMKATGTQGIL